MRSSPMVWLFACMYAFTSQMCCCQRADVAVLLAGGAGVASVEIAPLESMRIACCSKCADKQDGGQKSSDSDRTDSKSIPDPSTSNNCDDCEQCVAGAHVDGGTASKQIDAPAPALLNVLASLCASVEVDREAQPLRSIARETVWDAGQETLVRLHCALMV